MDDRVPMTPKGLLALQAELKKWKEEMPVVIKAIGEAREHGDLSENAEYHAARERQSIVDANIKHIEYQIARAEVIDPSKFTGTRIKFGAFVTVYDENRDEEISYQLVGDAEADIEHHRISVMSPLGRALIGRDEGDDVEFQTPGGKRNLSIVSVSYE